MDINCPKCGVKIDYDNINIQTSMAKCVGCRNVFSFAAQGGGHPSKQVIVTPPAGVQVHNDGMNFVITRKWFSAKILFLLSFCVFWDGFLFVWYGAAFSSQTPLIMKLFPIGHVAVGVFLTYTVIAGFLNKTIIRINNVDLSVRHTPLPWPGEKTISRGAVDQLFCDKHIHHHKRSTSTTFDLNVIYRGGERITLLKGLESHEQALYFEQQIEKALGVKDRVVPGEA